MLEGMVLSKGNINRNILINGNIKNEMIKKQISYENVWWYAFN